MKILLATDGSDNANAATDFLRSCPMPADTELTLITVIDKVVFGGEKPSQLIKSDKYDEDHQRMLLETEQMLRHTAGEILDEAESRLQGSISVKDKLVRTGHPSREIVREAEHLATDIVIVGTHGVGTMKRFLLGSTSDDVMRYSPCSVLIVRNRHGETESTVDIDSQPQPLKILLAFDNSPSARKATELCASLSAGVENDITALSVMPVVSMYRQDVRQQLSWIWQEQKKAVQKGLEWVTDVLTKKHMKVSTLVKESSDVKYEILDTAEALESDLIVIGDKGESALKRYLIGSTTWRVAHHASCSVLAVRVCS